MRPDELVRLKWGTGELVARVLEVDYSGGTALLCIDPDAHGPDTCGDTIRYALDDLGDYAEMISA